MQGWWRGVNFCKIMTEPGRLSPGLPPRQTSPAERIPMSRQRPSRRARRPAAASWRPLVVPRARPPYRAAWASAEGEPPGHEAVIGKVARFGDAPRVGRVSDVIFELETG